MLSEQGLGVEIPKTIIKSPYKTPLRSKSEHNYVLLNTELPEDDELIAIEFYGAIADSVYIDVRA